MGFLNDDEFFLLMDIERAAIDTGGQVPKDTGEGGIINGYMTEDELKRLVDIGVRTTIGPFSTMWNKIEATEGVYDWSLSDNYIDRAKRVGMKVLLFNATHYPQWFPDEWYVKTATSIEKGALSPWCSEAMDRNNRFTRTLMDRYASSDCMIINAQLRVGETVLLNEPAFYDAWALCDYRKKFGSDKFPIANQPETELWLRDSYINMLLEQQHILIEQEHREIWCMLHPAIAQMNLYGNGCNWIDDILSAYRLILNPSIINHIYYTWIQWAGCWPKMNEFRDKYGEHVFGGAEYCEGTIITTPVAIAQGLRGQIVAPCYPEVHDTLTDEMITHLITATNLWKKSNGN